MKNVRPNHLDCRTPESTFSHLSALTNVPIKIIEDRLQRISDETRFDLYRPDGEELWRRVFQSEYKKFTPKTITWFHATRVPRTETFKDGIRPLGLQIDHIWAMLEKLAAPYVSPEEWRKFCRCPRSQCDYQSGEMQYYHKLAHRELGGPYAFLLREEVFRAQEFNCHDYLETPEIVTDISQCTPGHWRVHLGGLFHEATAPCIVAFDSAQYLPNVLPGAILYLLGHVEGSDYGLDHGPGFSNYGETIPPESIVSIEFDPQP